MANVTEALQGTGSSIPSGANRYRTQDDPACSVIDDVTASSLVGRGSAGDGIVQEITLGTNLSMAGTTLNATGGGAPPGADYLVKTADAGLSAERVVGDSTSITADWATPGNVAFKRAALTGDVTAAANANSTTIANDAVTYAKMQDVSAASRIVGRGSAGGAGDPEEISLGTKIAMSGTTLDVPDATTTAKGAVELATDGESAANVVVQGNDSRMSNARTPTAHAASHQNGGSDEINVAGLSGMLADPQQAASHAADHELGGGDQLALNASQTVAGTMATARLGSGTANASTFLRGDQTWAAPTATVAFTEFTKDLGASCSSGTFDITGLSGLTAEKMVDVRQTAAKIASKGDARDESEFDSIALTGYVLNTTTIRCSWRATGVVVGTYAFAYLVSG